MKHSANLDMLRTLAISSVIADHWVLTLHAPADALRGTFAIRFGTALGHMGVLAFFVHTSLVLMYSLERMQRHDRFLTLSFYIRRIFRIYPLAIFAILLALIFHIPSNTWWQEKTVNYPGLIVANLLLLQNLRHMRDVLDPLWSLPFEIEMYIVLPLLFFIASRRRGATYVATLFIAASLLGVFVHRRTIQDYIPCFLAGVLCYALRDRLTPKLPAVLWPVFVCVVAVAYGLAVGQTKPEPAWMGWIACLALGLAIPLFRDSAHRRVNMVAAKVAQYSYGIYLLHVPVLYLVFDRLHIQNPWAASLLAILLTGAAAVAAFHALESPLMRVGKRLSHFPVAEPSAVL